MNEALVVQIVGLVVAAAEEVPSLVKTIVSAVEQSKSGTGPTADDIKAIFAECQALDGKIQAS